MIEIYTWGPNLQYISIDTAPSLFLNLIDQNFWYHWISLNHNGLMFGVDT